MTNYVSVRLLVLTTLKLQTEFFLSQTMILTLFYKGRGVIHPPWWFIVRRSTVGAPNRLIFYEFVPCNINTVLDRSFFSKIDPKGGPFYTKIKEIKKGIFFYCKSYFFYLNINSTCSQLSFEVSNMSVAQNFLFFTFFAKF